MATEPGPGTDVFARLLAAPRRVQALRATHSPALLAAGIDPQWLEDHIRSLAPRFADPVLARRRATHGLPWPAVRDAYAADTLARELAAAAAGLWTETYAAYLALGERWVSVRRARWRGPRVIRFDPADARAVRRRIARAGDPLLAQIERLARAPGETEWRRQRARLEERWAETWSAMAGDLADVWADTLAPRLSRVACMRAGPRAWVVAVALIGFVLALFMIGWQVR